MSWQSYIDNLTADGVVIEAAIAGCESGQESVWASKGEFCKITPAEIRQLMASDRSSLFSTGVTMGGVKCTVLRDNLNTDQNHTMDLKTKSSDTQPDTFNITVGKSNKALVIVKGAKDTHGGKLNPRAFSMAEHLRKSGY
ncbi:hypothetical protein JZ751_006724 [Albula glossodonta]|uniref:Profilin n=1 Tax=Albula glossodonta TaxID=121402 RepID=A0A8T2NZ87_9TELE|nr:hypothetical protein JZ751_006724 [Albula glossodonta]